MCLTAAASQESRPLFWHVLDKDHGMFWKNVIGMVDDVRASRCKVFLYPTSQFPNNDTYY